MKTLHVNPLAPFDELDRAREEAIKVFKNKIKGMESSDIVELFRLPMETLVDGGLGFQIKFTEALPELNEKITITRGELQQLIEIGATVTPDVNKIKRNFMIDLKSDIRGEALNAVIDAVKKTSEETKAQIIEFVRELSDDEGAMSWSFNSLLADIARFAEIAKEF